MEIKILGTGCPKCKTLEKVTRDAVTELGIDADISKEEDIINIMNYGKMHTSGLVINGKVVLPATQLRQRQKENLETLYPNQFKQGLITFQSLNLEEASTKPVAKRLGVAGQTLLIVKGDKKINLTNEGFMYAVVKPEKFKEIINERVDGLLAQ